VANQFLLRMLAALFGIAALSGNVLAATAAGEAAPDFALRSLDGKNLRLSEFRSEVVVLNFWAPWCNKCRKSSSALNDLYQIHKDAGLHVLSIDVGANAADARDYAAELNLTYPVLPDNQQSEVSKAYDPGRLPLTLLIDRAGNIRFIHAGSESVSNQLIAAEVAALLAE
jgi:peroxiredoxin